MKTFLVTLAAGAAMLSFAAGKAEAGSSPAPELIRSGDIAVTPALLGPVQAQGLFEKTQFWLWGGRNYCWYDFGWHGPGFYWCGYANRRGYGWGGPVGWRGWDHARGGGRGFQSGPYHGAGGFHGGGGGHGGGGFHDGGGHEGGGGHPSGGFHGGGGGGGHPSGGHSGGGGHHH